MVFEAPAFASYMESELRTEKMLPLLSEMSEIALDKVGWAV